MCSTGVGMKRLERQDDNTTPRSNNARLKGWKFFGIAPRLDSLWGPRLLIEGRPLQGRLPKVNRFLRAKCQPPLPYLRNVLLCNLPVPGNNTVRLG